MHPPGADAVVVRYGAIYTKSGEVRERMATRLADNVAALLGHRDIAGDVERTSGRLVVRTDDPEAAARAATDAPGVVSASPALVGPPTREAISDALAATARACYDGGSFAVDANRGTDQLPFTSQAVGEFGGAAVFDAVEDEFDPTVDLDDPDVTFGVDCRADEAFVFVETREGPGGLPVGSQEPLVALVSGGIDSPVAAFEVLRRGSPVLPVYVDLGDYGGPDHRARAVAAMRTVAGYAPNEVRAPRVVPAGDAVAALVDAMESGRMLALRRFMLRVGAAVAREHGCRGVVTGEALGQKSSQTAANLAVTDAATTLPVHRPLLSWDKTAVTERARELGTFDDSTVPAGCERVAPATPATAATLDVQRDREPDDLFERAARAAADAERLDVTPATEPR
jgi:thiamine biosynthesis protein ThiI